MRQLIPTILMILVSHAEFSQIKNTELFSEPKTIEGQFDKILQISSNYQTFKVVEKEELLKLKTMVLDSINKSKNLVLDLENLLKNERINIAILNDQITKTKLELESALKNENSAYFFGASMPKVTFNLLLIFIFFSLSIGLGYFLTKFMRSNILTKKAQENLLIVEEEFDIYRKKSIEREQKLRRQLQDEINKQKKI